MNNALWSPRGAQAGERTRTAGGTLINNRRKNYRTLTAHRTFQNMFLFYISVPVLKPNFQGVSTVEATTDTYIF